MECREFALQLDDLLDGRLDAVQRKSAQEHLERCPSCRRQHQHAVAVQEAVRSLSPPALHPGFMDQALSRATRPAVGSGRPAWRPLLGMALAASLVLGVALGVFLAARPTPVQTVALTLDRPETVRLMFNSAKPLRAATLSLALPENVELVGYGGRRELSWQTDLREGGNLMQLPLVVRGATKEELVASLSHGGNSKTFRLKIEVDNAASGMTPVPLAHIVGAVVGATSAYLPRIVNSMVPDRPGDAKAPLNSSGETAVERVAVKQTTARANEPIA